LNSGEKNLRLRWDIVASCQPGWRCLELSTKPDHPQAAPTKAWLSNLPADTPLARLIGYARPRWRVERDCQEGKGILGLDHYEGRTWAGLHHHIALAVVAHQLLAAERVGATHEAAPPRAPAAAAPPAAFPP
jgi:SRSO17 transposase